MVTGGRSGDGSLVMLSSCATITHVSVDGVGNEANGNTAAMFRGVYVRDASVSRDGRYITFPSEASNLVDADTAGVTDVFVHDRATGTTSRVSVDSAGNEANSWSSWPADQRRWPLRGVHVDCKRPGPGSARSRKERSCTTSQTGTTTLVSVDRAGDAVGNGSYPTSISGDGHRVAFVTRTDVFADDVLYVRDLDTGTTSMVASLGDAGYSPRPGCR